MKQIKIKQITAPDFTSVYTKQRMYSIYLGNNTTEYFSSARAAKNFLAKTNKFLNSKLHELNYLYSLLFVEYRRIWFYFDIENEVKIHTQLDDIEKKFNLSCSKSNYINGNVYTIKYLTQLGESISRLFELIKEILEQKKYYADMQRVNIYLRQVKNVIKEIDFFPKSLN